MSNSWHQRLGHPFFRQHLGGGGFPSIFQLARNESPLTAANLPKHCFQNVVMISSQPACRKMVKHSQTLWTPANQKQPNNRRKKNGSPIQSTKPQTCSAWIISASIGSSSGGN